MCATHSIHGNTPTLHKFHDNPVVTATSEKTLRFSRTLFENGIYALAVRPPTVPAGTARIRLSLNAEHTDSDIEKLLEVFNKMR